MPATESTFRPVRVTETYRLKDGRIVEVRGGLVCDTAYPPVSLVETSDESAAYLLGHAILTTKQRHDIAEHYQHVWPTAGRTEHRPTFLNQRA